jgi:glycosyltransferase involved in cell wall biosynthesis
MVAGDVPLDLQMQISHLFPQIKIQWLGVVNSSDIPALDRSAHMLFSADLNAACPNSVIEALACGLPVVAFDTGALSELVPPSAGAVVPYGSNHWKLEDPDIKSLTEAALPILKYNNRFREGARAAAVALFSLDSMIDAYLEVLLR